MIYQGKARYPVNEVVLHTSATPGDWWKGFKDADAMRDEIRLWHVRDRGWRDIGYQRVFAPDGSVAIGRSITEIGAGVRGHNRGVVHLCMIPVNTVDRMGRFADFYTAAQRKAVLGYIKELEKLAGPLLVSGHNDYAPKLCPGFKVRSSDWT